MSRTAEYYHELFYQESDETLYQHQMMQEWEQRDQYTKEWQHINQLIDFNALHDGQENIFIHRYRD